MKEHLEIMKVSLRVLNALSESVPPDDGDLEILRCYLGHEGPSNADELACEVIRKALWVRSRIRLAIRGEARIPLN
jgi:hypothetical protein